MTSHLFYTMQPRIMIPLLAALDKHGSEGCLQNYEWLRVRYPVEWIKKKNQESDNTFSDFVNQKRCYQTLSDVFVTVN